MKNCIFIEYGDREGIYWLLDKSTLKVFRSRDVKSNESKLVMSQDKEVEIYLEEEYRKQKEIEKKIMKILRLRKKKTTRT